MTDEEGCAYVYINIDGSVIKGLCEAFTLDGCPLHVLNDSHGQSHIFTYVTCHHRQQRHTAYRTYGTNFESLSFDASKFILLPKQSC